MPDVPDPTQIFDPSRRFRVTIEFNSQTQPLVFSCTNLTVDDNQINLESQVLSERVPVSSIARDRVRAVTLSFD